MRFIKILMISLFSSCVFAQKLYFSEDFKSYDFGKELSDNWKIQSVKGKNYWRVSSHKNSKTGKYLKISAYKGDLEEIDEAILSLDLSHCYEANFEFQSAIGYFQEKSQLELLISDSFSGNYSPIKNVRIANSENIRKGKFSSFISSGKIDISDYCGGFIHLKFAYKGSVENGATTYEIDDIKIFTR